MEENKNILFVIPDGVGIRNYVYSSLIDHLKNNIQLYFWTTLPDAAINEVESLHKVSIKHTRFSLPREPLLTRIYRESATYARLLYNSKKLKNSTIISTWSKDRKNLKLRLLLIIAEFIGKRASKKYKRILNLENKSIKYWDRRTIEFFKNQLEEIAPNSIFITHQRVAFLNPICIAASELSITVNCCIYSWDNTAKASLAIRTDRYLVWSDYMKEELSNLYPEIDNKKIVVTGTPQFEFYFQDERKIPRGVFAKRYGLDPLKKWICYSGDDEKTSPFDPLYLEDLAKSILEIPEGFRPQIIFRRCPVDVSDRFDDVIGKYSEIINVIDPLWNTDKVSWGTVYPKQEDIDLLVNITLHCELVINVGSTMSHDFAVYNKPCLFIKYDQKKNEKWSVETIYKFQHFRSMGDLDAVAWINNKEEIKEKILKVLKHSDVIAKDKQTWMKIIVRHPLQENAKLIAIQLIND